jgi:diacylglycerol kinase family enzyme
MDAIVVYNNKAGVGTNGSDDPTPESLREALAASGFNADIRAARGSEIVAALRAAVAERPGVLFAGGGDGTISTAAGFLADTEIPLGVLALGTLNHFARDIGVPIPWREAIASFATASIQSVDVAEVNGRVFINNCSLGSYAEAVRRRDKLRSEKGHGKWRAMVLASWAVFRELKRLRLQIETPDRALTLRTPFVLVANNRYTGHVLASSLRPRLDEGRLWIYTTRARRHGALIRLMWQSLTRRVDEADELEVHSLTEAVINSTKGSIPVAADGELIDVKLPLRFRIRPRALRVLAPAPSAAA